MGVPGGWGGGDDPVDDWSFVGAIGPKTLGRCSSVRRGRPSLNVESPPPMEADSHELLFWAIDYCSSTVRPWDSGVVPPALEAMYPVRSSVVTPISSSVGDGVLPRAKYVLWMKKS